MRMRRFRKMAARQQLRLRRVLSRFKRNELPGVVQWLVGNEETPVRGTKRDIVSSTLDAFSENKVSEHAITELELKYILTHPDSLQWKGYSLTYANALVPSMVDTDPQMFCKRFQVYLSNLDYDIADTLSTPYHWLALHIGGHGRVASYTCYMVRCPLTPCAILAGVKKPHLTTILDALCLTVGCSQWRDMELCGRSLSSLLDLMLNQASQGPYSAYRLNQKDPNPLLAVRRKRSRHHQGGSSTDSETDKRLKAAAESVFGTNPLPKLEKFTFKIEAPLAETEELISCSVKLSGSSVAQGLKQCVLSGAVGLPLPGVLTALTSSASNSVLVQEGCLVGHTHSPADNDENQHNRT